MYRKISGSMMAVACMLFALNGIVHASMAPPLANYTIASKASKGGSVTPAGKTVVSAGDKFSIAMTTNPGYYLADVVVDGASEGALPSKTFDSIAANHTLMAKFQKNPVIVATANAGGHISPAGQVSVPYGTDQSFTIEPDKGFHLVGVTVDGVDEGVIADRIFTAVTAKHQIKAQFAVNTYQLSSSIGEGGGGSIMPAEVTAKHGTAKVITVKADKGYVIGRVSVNGIEQKGFTGKLLAKFNPKGISENMLITASFIPATVVDGIYYLPAVGSEYLPLDAVNTLTEEPTPLYWRYQVTPTTPVTSKGVGITYSALTTYSPVTMQLKEQIQSVLTAGGVPGVINRNRTTHLTKDESNQFYYQTGIDLLSEGKELGPVSYKMTKLIALQPPYLEYFPARPGLDSYATGYTASSFTVADMTVTQKGISPVATSGPVKEVSTIYGKIKDAPGDAGCVEVQGKSYCDVIKVFTSGGRDYWLARGIGVIAMKETIDFGWGEGPQELVMELVDTNLTVSTPE